MSAGFDVLADEFFNAALPGGTTSIRQRYIASQQPYERDAKIYHPQHCSFLEMLKMHLLPRNEPVYMMCFFIVDAYAQQRMSAREAFDRLSCVLVNDAKLLEGAFYLFAPEIMELPEITLRLHDFEKNKRDMPPSDNANFVRTLRVLPN